MTNPFPGQTVYTQPFNQPVPSSPVPPNQITPVAPTPPAPQNGTGVLAATQLANGNVPANAVQSGGGTDSVLAQMSRGQFSLARDSYGQASVAPNAGGTKRVDPNPTTPTGDASALSFSQTAPTYTGS